MEERIRKLEERIKELEACVMELYVESAHWLNPPLFDSQRDKD